MRGIFGKWLGNSGAQDARNTKDTPVHYDPPPDDPAQRTQWFNALERQWQTAWHDLFDRDAAMIAAGEFARPAPLPDDIGRDTRLIFGLSRAEKATRAACFAPFPAGAEMAKRLDDYLSGVGTPMPEDAARAELAALASLLPTTEPNEEVDFDRVTIVDRDTKEGLAALRDTDNITIVLEGSGLERRTHGDPVKAAARSFLTEPLFASAGNYYHLADWVTAAMYGGESDAVYGLLFRLWAGGWQVALGAEGVILAKRHVGPRKDAGQG